MGSGAGMGVANQHFYIDVADPSSIRLKKIVYIYLSLW